MPKKIIFVNTNDENQFKIKMMKTLQKKLTMKSFTFLLLLLCGLNFAQVPNGDFSSGTTGWSITPATFSMSASAGYMQVNLSGIYSNRFYLNSSTFAVPAGNLSIQYSFTNIYYDPMTGYQPMGSPDVRVKDTSGNLIAYYNGGTSCSNNTQIFGLPPTNSCTTLNLPIAVAGNYYVEFSASINPTRYFVIDNIAYTTSVTLQTGEISTEKISIYPNPAKDNITIKNAKNISGFKIYDSAGRAIKISKTNSEILDVSTLKKGNYIIEILSEDKSFRTQFIKE